MDGRSAKDLILVRALTLFSSSVSEAKTYPCCSILPPPSDGGKSAEDGVEERRMVVQMGIEQRWVL